MIWLFFGTVFFQESSVYLQQHTDVEYRCEFYLDSVCSTCATGTIVQKMSELRHKLPTVSFVIILNKNSFSKNDIANFNTSYTTLDLLFELSSNTQNSHGRLLIRRNDGRVMLDRKFVPSKEDLITHFLRSFSDFYVKFIK